MHVRDEWTSPGPTGKRVRNARWGRGKRWLARWTIPGTHREKAQAFETKDRAESFLARLRSSIADGTYIDPKAGLATGQATVGSYVDRWLATKANKSENTRTQYAGIRRGARFAGQWDAEPVAKVTRATVREWLARVHGEVGASRTRTHHVVLHGALALALDDRAIPTNPAADIRDLPKLPEKKPKALSVEQIVDYVRALEDHSEGAACFGLTLLFSALRFGECTRLDIGDLSGRHLIVEHSIATIGGRQVEADTKSHRQRTVPLPLPVVERIRDFVKDRKDGPLLPAPRGGRWHHGSWTRVHKEACKRAGLPEETTTHTLRHTAVSIAVDSGADVKAVQEIVGHKSATLTLDTYSWLRKGKLEEVADAMAPVVPLRTLRANG